MFRTRDTRSHRNYRCLYFTSIHDTSKEMPETHMRRQPMLVIPSHVSVNSRPNSYPAGFIITRHRTTRSVPHISPNTSPSWFHHHSAQDYAQSSAQESKYLPIQVSRAPPWLCSWCHAHTSFQLVRSRRDFATIT